MSNCNYCIGYGRTIELVLGHAVNYHQIELKHFGPMMTTNPHVMG